MAECEAKYGCNKCGRYVEIKAKFGAFDFGNFDFDNKQLKEICICKKNKSKR